MSYQTPSLKSHRRIIVKVRGILRARGTLECDVEPYILENDIHPIFARQNWGRKAVFENWKPTLRLSSFFLTERGLTDFWVQAALGKVERYPDVDEDIEDLPDTAHYSMWPLNGLLTKLTNKMATRTFLANGYYLSKPKISEENIE